MCFFVSSLQLPFCACFYAVNRFAVTSRLRGVAFCHRCPEGPNGAVSLIAWVWCSKSVPCLNYVDLPVVTECWFLLTTLMWQWPLGWLTVRLSSYHSVQTAVQVLTTLSGIRHSRVWCLLRSLFGDAVCEAYWILLWCCLKLVPGCVGSAPLARDCGTGQCQIPPVTALGELELQMIHILWFPLLGLGTCRKDRAVHQCWLLPASSRGTGQQKPQGTWTRSAPACLQLLLPEGCPARFIP